MKRRRITIEAPVSALRLAGFVLRRSGDERLVDVGEQIRQALRPGGTPMPWCVWCEVAGRRRRAASYDQGSGTPECASCEAESISLRRQGELERARAAADALPDLSR